MGDLPFVLFGEDYPPAVQIDARGIAEFAARTVQPLSAPAYQHMRQDVGISRRRQGRRLDRGYEGFQPAVLKTAACLFQGKEIPQFGGALQRR